MIRVITFAFLFFLYSAALSAQTCVNSIVPTSDLSTYELNENGSTTDRNFNIMWSRCSLGQTWQSGKCLGKPLLTTWDEAQTLAKASTLLSFNNWRLPSIHELSAATELSCQNPSINLTLFPNTTSLHFWTSAEFVNDTNNAWQIFFGTGENHTAKKSSKAAVRLVRSINGNK